MKMANNQEISIEMIAQIAMLAANAAVEAILEWRRHQNIFTRCRGNIKDMRHRNNGHSLVYTYADKVNNGLHNPKIYKAKIKDSSEARNIRDRQNLQKGKWR